MNNLDSHIEIEKQKTIIQSILIILLTLTIILVDLQYWYVFCNPKHELSDAQCTIVNTEFINKIPTDIPTPSKKELKEIISKQINTPHIYIEKDDLKLSKFSKNTGNIVLGKTIIMFRVIQIRKSFDIVTYGEYDEEYYYTITYVHELCHVKYQVQNETRTAYNTFIELFNSNNKYLQKVAGLYYKQMCENGLDSTYQCSAAINTYLEGKVYF